ncbi:MAG: hypothetical protein ABIQ51_01225 [Mesorhizobium sp.]
MDNRKPYETPKWWPGAQTWRPGGEDREAMCCAFCGGRDHGYEQCPQRDATAGSPVDDQSGPGTGPV